MENSIKSVLVMGGAGYLGSMLSEQLIESGFKVTIFDSLLFSDSHIKDLIESEQCQLIKSDIRDSKSVGEAVKDHDAVILLSALVGEGACDKDSDDTVSVNILGSQNVIEACRYYKTKKFIFASTDSCYGIQTGILTELSGLNPISLYAETKTLIEQRIFTAYHEDMQKTMGQARESYPWNPTILRMGTLYGLSRRMRFDLVVNILTWQAAISGKIPIYGGEQWRPLVHVRDAAKAYIAVLNAPVEQVSGQVFNVGSNPQNIQIKDLGKIIAKEFPEAQTEFIPQSPDLRDYHVDFSKISSTLGWKADWTISNGIKEIKESILAGRFGKEILPIYRNS